MCATKLATVLRRRVESALCPIGKFFSMTPICVSYVCRFPFWSVRHSMCVLLSECSLASEFFGQAAVIGKRVQAIRRKRPTLFLS